MKSRTKAKNTSTKSPPFYNKNRLLLELVTIAFIIIMFGTAFFVRPLLPDKIPTHWNAAGVADGFSSRNGVFVVPIIFMVLSVLLFILPLMEVFRENMLKIYKYYYGFKIVFGIFFLVLFISTLLPNFGYDINVSYIVMLMMGLLFISLGVILPKLKRNFMFGIRTGWTLSSDRVWDKTHKIGGILFILVGAITILMLFVLRLELLFWLFMILIMSVSLFLVFYSYYIFKHDRSIKK